MENTNQNSAQTAVSNSNQNGRKTYAKTHVPVEGYQIEELRSMDLENLIAIADELGVENPREFRRQALVFEILRMQTKQGGFILFTGILEVTAEGYGFLRGIDSNLSDSANDAYVSLSQIRKFAFWRRVWFSWRSLVLDGSQAKAEPIC